jgi:hypothetical protein
MAELPASFIQNFREAAPSYRVGQNPETDALFNPSITARPLHVPQAGQIAKRLNNEMEFFWAFDRLGQNPYHERAERLRSVGFEYATTKDVQMAVEDVIKGKDASGFSSEIRNGDLRLMKVPKRRWLEIRKSQQLQAIMMMNPRGKVMGEDGTVMGVNSLIPGVRTTVSDEPVEDIRARAVVSNAAEDLKNVSEGGRPTGNASVVSAEKVNKR